MLKIANKEFNSRLIIGTGKFGSNKIMRDAILASGTKLVTVAIRRVDFNSKDDDIINYIPEGVEILPNTSGARNASEALRIAKLARASSGTNWIKLEVVSDHKYLLPDPIETLKAAEILVKVGFIVLPYINADPMLCMKLEDVGCSAVMPLASPIGTNKGIKNMDMLKIIIENVNVPVIVDAGLGSPSDASLAMELGASAVMVNTAIAVSNDPVRMAQAFDMGVRAGRLACISGIAKESKVAIASSPLTGFLE